MWTWINVLWGIQLTSRPPLDSWNDTPNNPGLFALAKSGILLLYLGGSKPLLVWKSSGWATQPQLSTCLMGWNSSERRLCWQYACEILSWQEYQWLHNDCSIECFNNQLCCWEPCAGSVVYFPSDCKRRKGIVGKWLQQISWSYIYLGHWLWKIVNSTSHHLTWKW